MGRFRREHEETERNNPNARYEMAFKKMKRIKGFYVHLAVYLIFNTIVIFTGDIRFIDEGSLDLGNFSLAFYWGIGLAAHGASVFGRDLFFGKDWEARKIREFMGKENHKTE
jgi:hypothetical protein